MDTAILSSKLHFEDTLMRDMRRRKRHHPVVRIRTIAIFFLFGALAAAGGAMVLFFFNNPGKKPALAMAAFAEAIKANDLPGAAQNCKEGALGAQLLIAEQAKSFKPKALKPLEQNEAVLAGCIERLGTIRAELESAGLDWTQAKVFAFGGVSSSVFNPEVMLEPVEAIAGNIYITDENGAYFIELTTMKCFESYVIMDIWQWGRLEGGAIKAHAGNVLAEFKEDSFDIPDAELGKPASIYYKFEFLARYWQSQDTSPQIDKGAEEAEEAEKKKPVQPPKGIETK